MRFFADSNHSVVYEFTIQGKNHSNLPSVGVEKKDGHRRRSS